MSTPQPPNLQKLRDRRKVPLEGLAWLCFVLLTLAFGIFMTCSSFAASKGIVEPKNALSVLVDSRDRWDSRKTDSKE